MREIVKIIFFALSVITLSTCAAQGPDVTPEYSLYDYNSCNDFCNNPMRQRDDDRYYSRCMEDCRVQSKLRR